MIEDILLRRKPVLRFLPTLFGAIAGALMAVHAVADDSRGAAEMLTVMTDRVLLEIRNNPAILEDELCVRSVAEKVILPNVDFQAAAQWVLGKHWRRASPAQRAAFAGEFREMLLNTYLQSLGKYRDNSIRILAARPGQPEGRAVVDAEVLQPGAPPVNIFFRLHYRDGNWLVYDVVIEGISLVATHRSSFATEIRNKGLDSLIARLVLRNASEATAAGNSPAQEPVCARSSKSIFTNASPLIKPPP